MAQGGLADMRAGEGGAEGVLVELAGEVLEGGNADDLAVDHALGRDQPLIATEDAERGLGDHLVDNLAEGAAPQERAHVAVRRQTGRASCRASVCQYV